MSGPDKRRIEPGMLCYIKWHPIHNSARERRVGKYRGSIVEAQEQLDDFRRELMMLNVDSPVWIIKALDNRILYIAEYLLIPIPPDDMETLRRTQRPNEVGYDA